MNPAFAAIFLAALMPASAMAQTATWYVAGQTGEGDNRLLTMVDARSVMAPSSNVRDVWTSGVYPKTRAFHDGRQYDEVRIRNRYDCTANTYTILGSSLRLNNAVVFGGDHPGDPVKLNPESVAQRVATAVCTDNFSALKRIQAATPVAEGKRHFGQ
ncbi:MAG: hypothetical protein EOP62_10340 [Sphingomonadales bacterium]|nr:MAG: hypothetical protein EOP62_10340 [Sphingomonadales bacterium]